MTNERGEDMESTTIVVGAGRNIGAGSSFERAECLSDASWRRFRRTIDDLLSTVGCEIYFRGTGAGASTEWGDEESYTVVASVPAPGRMADVRRGLGNLAQAFGQDAIALTVGTTEFLGGAR